MASLAKAHAVPPKSTASAASEGPPPPHSSLEAEDTCPDLDNPQQVDQDSDQHGDLCDGQRMMTEYVLSEPSVQQSLQMSDGKFLLQIGRKDTIHRSDDRRFRMFVELSP